MVRFPHRSRPGIQGTTFPEELLSYLSLIATAVIPGDDVYPSGAEAQVPSFIELRASIMDLAAFESLMARYPAGSPGIAADRVAEMERDEPMTFAWLREFVYHGYYASHRTLAAMADRGYEYRGAPQPLGYTIDDVMMTPQAHRGSYIPTAGVKRVSL
jgi:hypothetical protein